MNDSEEKPLTLSELRALAEKQDLLNGLASKARGRKTQNKGKCEEVSEQHLLSLGGTKVGAQIVFGPEGETQLTFRPSKGRSEGAARWTVSLKGNISHYDTQRELNKANRGLWDKEKGEPSVAFKAARQLLACHVEKLQACHVDVRRLHELTEEPEIDRGIVSEQLDRVNEQLIMAQDAISLAVEALSKGLGTKMQKAFDMLRDDSQWPQDIVKLQRYAMDLAADLQRPPTKAELRRRYDPDRRIDPSKFAKLLRHAGLWWMRRESLVT